MNKLYKRLKGKVGKYHEAWANGSTIVEHWGSVGDIGQTKEHKRARGVKAQAQIETILKAARQRGFGEVDIDDHARLVVEYKIKGHGTGKDLDTLLQLEDHLNQLLGWIGIGHCDGNDIGSGAMACYCFVVDYSIAKREVVRSLKGSEFENYERVYRPR